MVAFELAAGLPAWWGGGGDDGMRDAGRALQVSSRVGTSVSIGSQPGIESTRNLGPCWRTTNHRPAVRVMGSDGIWGRGSHFLPTSDRHCRPGRFPDMPAQGNMSRWPSRLADDVARSGGVVCWLCGSCPWPRWPSQAVPADGSERVVGGFGVCAVMGVVCRARRAVPLF